MSIAVGKRNFAENFSKMMINDFQRDNIYRSKMVVNENTLTNRTYTNQPTASYYSDNVRVLAQQFPQVDQRELLTVLDDCDNDLEIAVEILQKDIQNKVNSPKLVPMEGRNIKKINGAKEAEQKSNVSAIRQVEERKSDNSIQEEDPAASAKWAETRNLSSNVIDKLQTLSTMDEAKELLTQIILEIRAEDEKTSQVVVNKLSNDRNILIKAFNKQRVKAQTAEEKNEELTILLSNHDQEIARLKTINYKLGLRLRAFDENQEENHNFDIY